MNKQQILTLIASLLLIGNSVMANLFYPAYLYVGNGSYPENNTPPNIVNAGYDMIVAMISGITPYIAVIIGIGVLMFVITVLSASVGLIVFSIFKLFTKKR